MINKLISIAILFTASTAQSQYKDFERPFGNPLVLSTITYPVESKVQKQPMSVAIIQIGAFKNKNRAEKEWDKLSKQFPFISSLNKVIVPYYGGMRLRAEAATVSNAKNICRNIIAGGKDCFFVGKEFKGQTVINAKPRNEAVKKPIEKIKSAPAKSGFELAFDENGNIKNSTTVDTLLEAYKNDITKARKTYEHGSVSITGKIKNHQNADSKYAALVLSNSSGKQSMTVYIDDKSSSATQVINIGEMVSLKCDAIQSTGTEVTATNCII